MMPSLKPTNTPNFSRRKMGVPALYRWLTQRYPEIRKRVTKDSKLEVDNLFLDFNSIIHPCCNKELDSMEETDKQLYRNITNYLDMIMMRMKPKRLLYISIDGVSPRAKLNQQRSRRFITAKENAEAGSTYFKASTPNFVSKEDGTSVEDSLEYLLDDHDQANQIFDQNSITPGTEFMERLGCFINDLIGYKMSSDPLWEKITVILSGYKVPGEGEQKILEYIKKLPEKQVSVIYSPDADLIFLGLTLHNYRLYVMREEFQPKSDKPAVPNDKNPYLSKEIVLVDICYLRQVLIDHFRRSIPFNFSYNNFIEDWVFICVSIGNDFLPSIPCLDIRANAVEKITSLLISSFRKTKKHITKNGNIDLATLTDFFAACAEREDEFLVEKKQKVLEIRSRMNVPLKANLEFDLDNDDGKRRYYMEKMGISSIDELENACKEYIKGMLWVYKYYFYSVPSWEWYYPYHFAPFMIDLAAVTNVNFSFNFGRPLKPMEQLLAVLPPLSRDLLPECFHDFFTQNTHFYPSDFVIDSFQKCMEWQAIPILPFIDIEKITRGYKERQKMLTFKETERNSVGYPLIYSRNPRFLSKVGSLYSGSKPYENIEIPGFIGRVFPIPNLRSTGDCIESGGFTFINRISVASFDQRKVCSRPKSQNMPTKNK